MDATSSVCCLPWCRYGWYGSIPFSSSVYTSTLHSLLWQLQVFDLLAVLVLFAVFLMGVERSLQRVSFCEAAPGRSKKPFMNCFQNPKILRTLDLSQTQRQRILGTVFNV